MAGFTGRRPIELMRHIDVCEVCAEARLRGIEASYGRASSPEPTYVQEARR